MRSKTAILAGWAMLVTVGWARGQEAQEPPVRVGFFNLAVVLQRSDMIQEMRKELDKVGNGFKKNIEGQRLTIDKVRKDLGDPALPPEQREILERKLKAAVRKLEDTEQEARTILTKKQESQIVAIYKEVRDAVKSYAEDHHFGAIMAYGDVLEEKDLLNPAAVQRRLNGVNTGGTTPFYIHPRNDLTNLILDAVNLRHRELKETSSK